MARSCFRFLAHLAATNVRLLAAPPIDDDKGYDADNEMSPPWRAAAVLTLSEVSMVASAHRNGKAR